MQTIWDQFELDWWDDPISNMTVSLLTNYGDDGIMSAMASEITGVVIVFTTVGSGAYEKASRLCVFVRGIHRWPVNSPHKRPITQKMFPLDDYIMTYRSAKICQWATSYFTVISIKKIKYYKLLSISRNTIVNNDYHFLWAIWWHVLQNYVSRDLQYFRQSSENDCEIK